MSNNNTPESPAKSYDGFYKYDQAVAQDYEKVREIELHWQQEDEFVKGYFQGRQIENLLDLPVGTGRFIPHFAGVRHLIGVDISEEMLSEARKKVPLRPASTTTQLERGDVFALRFNTGQFDTAIVCRLFHLLPPDLLPKAIKELCRVTSREIVVQTYPPLPVNPWRVWGKRILSLPRRVKNRLFPAKPAPPTAAKPWSHIRSYGHVQAQIDSCFSEHGFVVSVSKPLDQYEGGEVRMTVYVRR